MFSKEVLPIDPGTNSSTTQSRQRRAIIARELRIRHGVELPLLSGSELRRRTDHSMKKIPLEERFPPLDRPMFGFGPKMTILNVENTHQQNPDQNANVPSPTLSGSTLSLWMDTPASILHSDPSNVSLFSLNSSAQGSPIVPRDLPFAPVQRFRWSVSSNSDSEEPEAMSAATERSRVSNDRSQLKNQRQIYTRRRTGGTYTDTEEEEEENAENMDNGLIVNLNRPTENGQFTKNITKNTTHYNGKKIGTPGQRMPQSSDPNWSNGPQNSSAGRVRRLSGSTENSAATTATSNSPLVQYIDHQGIPFFACQNNDLEEYWPRLQQQQSMDPLDSPTPNSPQQHLSHPPPSVSSSADRTLTGDASSLCTSIATRRHKFELFAELDLLRALGRTLNLTCNVRQKEGSFIFANPTFGRLIVLTCCEAPSEEGIRISQHKDGHLFREAHISSNLEKWLVSGLLRGLCQEFLVP